MKDSVPSLIAELLQRRPLAPLGPGRPLQEFRSQLEEASAAFPSDGDRDMSAACRAGLWLAFNFLDESHTLSQDIATPTGSFWHAVMHRREPDASNSKYWWRRVGNHPVLDSLRQQAPALGYSFADPFGFVDFVERVRDTGTAEEELARRIQHLEWQLLYDWCFTALAGTRCSLNQGKTSPPLDPQSS